MALHGFSMISFCLKSLSSPLVPLAATPNYLVKKPGLWKQHVGCTQRAPKHNQPCSSQQDDRGTGWGIRAIADIHINLASGILANLLSILMHIHDG